MMCRVGSVEAEEQPTRAFGVILMILILLSLERLGREFFPVVK
jgi:hypothetical protein